jgi:hypothetical protein
VTARKGAAPSTLILSGNALMGSAGLVDGLARLVDGFFFFYFCGHFRATASVNRH